MQALAQSESGRVGKGAVIMKAEEQDTPPSGLSRPLTQIELATVLGVDRRTIQRALAAGQPLGGWKPIQIGARVKFIREEQAPKTTQ